MAFCPHCRNAIYPPPPFPTPYAPQFVPPPQFAPQMPMCVHGDGCWRKDCIYEHPRGAASARPTARVCLAFLTNSCKFGAACRHRHDPSDAEIAILRAAFASTPCKHGAKCENEFCMFKHPASSESADGSHSPYA